MDRSPLPPAITGHAAFLRLLAAEGVSHLFGNPGTTELAIMEAMSKQSDLAYVLGLQEGVVVAMADGYARASGRLAAANVHVAPGLGNAMGALYNARFYGSPVLLTAGQQEQGHALTEPHRNFRPRPIAGLRQSEVECDRSSLPAQSVWFSRPGRSPEWPGREALVQAQTCLMHADQRKELSCRSDRARNVGGAVPLACVGAGAGESQRFP